MPRLALIVVMVLAFILVTGLGCGPKPTEPIQNAGKTQAVSEESSSSKTAWPEWSGPKSLGPGQNLPDLWYIEFVHFPKAGSAHCYKISLDSEGNWGDTYNIKGQLTPQELQAVKSALAKINWDLVPQWAAKDYLAYTITPKSWPFPSDENPYYQVMMWLNQTNSSPPSHGRAIVADLNAPCPPEFKEVIEVIKPLQEKYQPQMH